MIRKFLYAAIAVLAVSHTVRAEWHYWQVDSKNRFICESSADGTTTNWLFKAGVVSSSDRELKIPDGGSAVSSSAYLAGSGTLDFTDFEKDTGWKLVQIGGWMLGFTDSLKHIVTGKLVLPDVRSVGIWSFSYQDITEVWAPELKAISAAVDKAGAFEGCILLEKAYVPKAEALGKGSFYGCSSLTDIGALDNLITIKGGAFQGCTSLSAFPMVLPKVTTIGANAFESVPLTGDFYLPCVTNVGGWCFTSKSLTGFIAPKLEVMVGKNTFNGCTAITNFVAGHGLRKLGSTTSKFSPGLPVALQNFTPLMPREMEDVYAQTFQDKSALVTPLVWDCPNMTAIPGSFFSGCSKMCDITIGRTVKSIGANAFANIAQGAIVRFKGPPPEMADKAFYYKNRGAETSNRRPQFRITSRAAVEAWAASEIVTANAETFETFKTKPDYPGPRTFGLVKISSAASDTQYAWVVDDVKGFVISVK